MIKDDIVALLPDLRAFARFMCREREAADELVQNTILAALDKQDQFAAGTNLKGWLFTIMRNRFYSDLRSQRRRPTAIDDSSIAPLAAVDNPEASLQLRGCRRVAAGPGRAKRGSVGAGGTTRGGGACAAARWER
jgi:RNA polymerase sigma-70 factor (ECF subfamily)